MMSSKSCENMKEKKNDFLSILIPTRTVGTTILNGEHYRLRLGNHTTPKKHRFINFGF